MLTMFLSLQATNSLVRCHAAALFFEVFPLQGADTGVQEEDAFLQKQFNMLQVGTLL